MVDAIVFSIDGSAYQRWQAQLLRYSIDRARQPGRLIALVSSDGAANAGTGEQFLTPSYSRYGGDRYPPYNRIMATADWLDAPGERPQTLLLVDPDFVFLRPFTATVTRGAPIAQPMTKMFDTASPIIERFCRNPDRVQFVGVPIVIHVDDLREIVPLWREKTLAIRHDPAAHLQAGWIAEMWGYVLAAAELGMTHTVQAMAHFAGSDLDALPMVHYTYPFQNRGQGWTWDKRRYEPWCAVELPRDLPKSAARLLILLNELAALKGHHRYR